MRPRLSSSQVQLLGLETPIPARNVWSPVLTPHLAESWLPHCPSPYHEGGGSLPPLLCPSLVSCPFPGRSAPGGATPSESCLAASTPFTAPLDVQKRLTPWEVSGSPIKVLSAHAHRPEHGPRQGVLPLSETILYEIEKSVLFISSLQARTLL